jgi:hypothetical protein
MRERESAKDIPTPLWLLPCLPRLSSAITLQGQPILCGLLPPVDEREGVAKLLNTLIVRGVASDEFQAMRNGYRRSDGVTTANRSADTIQIAGDLSCQVSPDLVEDEYFVTPADKLAPGDRTNVAVRDRKREIAREGLYRIADLLTS